MSILKRIVNKFLNSKVVDLDNDGKIETLREEIQGVFSQFKRMNEQLTSVNTRLNDIVAEEELAKEVENDRLARIAKEVEENNALSDERIKKIKLEMEVNEKLQEKVSEFLPK